MKFQKLSVEKTKTILLNFLVLLSIFLTWQVWTFEPDYNSSEEPDANVKVGEILDNYAEVIKPHQLVFHDGNNHYTAYNQSIINPIYSDLVNFMTVEEIESISVSKAEKLLSDRKGMEFIFPTMITEDVLSKLFDFNTQDTDIPDITDKIIVLEPSANEKVNDTTDVLLVYSAKKEIFQATVKTSLLKQWFLHQPDGFIEASLVSNNLNSAFFEGIYAPINQMTDVNKIKGVTIKTIKANEYKEALFPDPELVETNDIAFSIEQSYTDGTRNLKVRNDEITFTNPKQAENRYVPNEQPIIRAFDFVNNHGGFKLPPQSEEYMLFHWNRPEKTDQVIFRSQITGIPIMENYTIEVDEQNNDVLRYVRSLKYFFVVPPQAVEVQLESAQQIAEQLEKRNIKLSSVKRIVVGYETSIDQEIENNTEYILEPGWYVQVNDSWVKLFQNNNEGVGKNGLEQG
ncbi:YycH family regulatory protein [Pseudalkalibacillus caeni]|uniref:Regulatory protein YycH domain-containing protein n=1 Tax=Exobacillus caeni TaxID=2574798 RepID=A0A5R9EWJ1_9BACL|nr:two-component system activity regulator YycH [Pseudalkalibacillus caeni]TLS35417.1 hypothetical protein FCL54_20700 [Pseudalkalibacillus caeni]